jgi:hypothetical protein
MSVFLAEFGKGCGILSLLASASMGSSQLQLREFLLGKLDARVAEEIDLRILSEEDFEEVLIFAEHELIEDFLEGSLPPPDEEMFLINFAVNPKRKELIDEIRLMKAYSEQRRASLGVSTTERSHWGLFSSLKSWITLKPRFAAGATFVFVFIAVLGFWTVWNRSSTEGLSGLEAEYSQLNENLPQQPKALENQSTLNLIPGSFRDDSQGARYRLEILSDRILCRLALPAGAPSNQVFAVRLVKDQKVIFSQPRVHVYENPNGNEVRFYLPKSILPKGQIEMKIQDSDRSGLSYNFVIE